ncbi:MAG: 3-hydroxybutyryl-CoA dehydrogenase [Acidimicrobiia bacterium]|nr:3-hydroxybutyryl-CoA dehydrogenase [Acidimicrobiia bacterium]
MERVGIVGAGQMGAGIAEVCARSGCAVVLAEVDDAAIGRGLAGIEKSLAKAVEREKLTAADAEAARGRLTTTTDISQLGDSQIVIEAIVENESAKRNLFTELDGILADGAILASNTSSIPIVRLATATQRPESVIGMHFFNPAPIMPLVEVVSSLLTSSEAAAAVTAFATELGKHPVAAKDRAGFIVNALLLPMLVDAVRMFEAGVASAEDIDAALVLGANHPMGPLALADLIGIDTVVAVSDVLYAEFAEPRYAPSPLLRRMVDAGHLGRKTGQGFYSY